MVVLAVVFPLTDIADFVPAPLPQGEEAAAGAGAGSVPRQANVDEGAAVTGIAAFSSSASRAAHRPKLPRLSHGPDAIVVARLAQSVCPPRAVPVFGGAA